MLIFGHGTLSLLDGTNAVIKGGGNYLIITTHLNFIAWFRLSLLVFKEISVQFDMNLYTLDEISEIYEDIHDSIKNQLEWLKTSNIEQFNYETSLYNDTVEILEMDLDEEEFNQALLYIYKKIRISDLDPYPKLSYDQGQHNSFYFWEEILADYASPKNITVTDRATLFNLVIGLNGYTISSGIIYHDLNGEDIVAVPLDVDEEIEIGYITSNHHKLRPIAQRYIEILEKTTQLGFKTTEIAN